MRFVTCVIKPFRLDPIVQALSEVEIEELIISHVRGYGRQKGHTTTYRESEYLIVFLPKIMIEFAIDDDDRGGAIERIIKVARTGRIGDGKIFIQDVEAWASFD